MPQSKASNADIGYSNGLLLSTSVEVYKGAYIQAGLGKDIEIYGVGAGYSINSFDFMLFANKLEDSEEIELKVEYYDIGPSFFLSLGNEFTDYGNKITYKVGAGYPVREGVSLIAHYSNAKVFLGVRSHF